MDIGTVTVNALNAARTAAGATWGQIQHNFDKDINAVIENGANIEILLKTNQISEDDAADLLKEESLSLFILSQEMIVDGEVIAQNAINAAIDVLWTAVKAAAKLPL